MLKSKEFSPKLIKLVWIPVTSLHFELEELEESSQFMGVEVGVGVGVVVVVGVGVGVGVGVEVSLSVEVFPSGNLVL